MSTAMRSVILRHRCQRRMVRGMSITYSCMGIASKCDKESPTANTNRRLCSTHGIEPRELIAVRDNGIGLCCAAVDVREQIDNGHRLYIGVLAAVWTDTHESLLTICAGTWLSQHNKKAPLSVSLKSACIGR